MLKTSFIKATEAYNELFDFCGPHVPAPMIRKVFSAEKADLAKIQIACCGFYRLFLNGQELTKGFLAPYVSNPNDFVYYDCYEAPVQKGENVIGLVLGNGFQNNPGGFIWDFDYADFRSAPLVSMTLTYGDTTVVTDTTWKTAPSAIRCDDYRFGEVYDATCEIPGWNLPGFDDSAWTPVLNAPTPKGELKFCAVEPLRTEKELKPIAIFPDSKGDGYIYDFGEVNAGVCRLTVKGEKGQKIAFQHADTLKDGTLYLDKIWFAYNDIGRYNWDRDRHIVHRDFYTCKGEGVETYTPSFTYHGFRYAKVTGITAEQATEDLLTYVVFHSDFETKGGFTCSDDTLNKLQEATRRSDISNFHYIPTDCPQREKNGWTADAALSAEQMLLNFSCECSYAEWLRNVCKAQNKQGAFPGIVPTPGWGFEWGNGPAWDRALVAVPHAIYTLRGDTGIIKEVTPYLVKYLSYLRSRMDDRGLLEFGLGDWCQVCWKEWEEPIKAPLVVTDSIMSLDIAIKSAVLFEAVGFKKEQQDALELEEKLRASIRKHLIDFDTMTVLGNCQSSQALAIYYGLFTEEELPKALDKYLELIHEANDHIDVGVVGARIMFYVLSKYGYTDLALHMIARPDYPSFGNWIANGATTLWEDIRPMGVNSTNHHFWGGSFAGWFYTNLAGIGLNPTQHNVNEVRIQPEFASQLTFVDAWHEAPAGKIASRWERKGEEIELTLTIPETMTAEAVLPKGYCFTDGTTAKPVTSGNYTVKKA